jgi:hypothetical protein
MKSNIKEKILESIAMETHGLVRKLQAEDKKNMIRIRISEQQKEHFIKEMPKIPSAELER